MVFRASKKREIREPDPVAQGTQLIPSAPTRIWYERELKKMVRAMLSDYREEINFLLEKPAVEQFYAQDASPSSVFKRGLDKLAIKWKSLFTKAANKLTSEFLLKVDEHSKVTTFKSLSTAGIIHPKTTYNKSIEQTLESAQEFNHTLITNIAAEAHERIHNAVMLSLTSPNPEEQGQQGILSAVNKIEGMTLRRAELIAVDQNSKVYASLNADRMRQNGISKFKWIHSSAGKVPRQSHVDKDEKIFAIDDPELWTGPKSDQGPPGWAINCRCRAVPVIDLD